MKRLKNLYEQIYDYQNLHEAYRQARKCKRYRKDVLQFSYNLEENLISLQNELIWQTYEVGRYREFIVHDPKRRLIMALPFRDRVVQWAIYRQLNPLLDRRYISTSYACRVGYGSHKAVKRIQYWLRKLSRSSEPVYVLKLDVSKYFYRVDHNVLMNILIRKINDQRLINLLEKIIRCDRVEFGLPLTDGGQFTERASNVGMPIGNLTSQMFANLYLNELDQFVKHALKVKHYARYMDDMLVIGSNRHELRAIWAAIGNYLSNVLRLNLNNKSCIRSAAQGVEFCGYRIWPTRIKLRKSTALKMRRNLRGAAKRYRRGEISHDRLNSTVQSYAGLVQLVSSEGLQNIVKGVRDERRSGIKVIGRNQ